MPTHASLRRGLQHFLRHFQVADLGRFLSHALLVVYEQDITAALRDPVTQEYI